VLRSADAVVAQSTDTARNVVAYYGRELRSSLRVIPLPFDVAHARRLLAAGQSQHSRPGLRPGARHMVAVGRLIRRKRFDNLILSLKHLPADVRLVIVGEGELEGPLRQLASREGLSERVSLVGRVGEERKFAYLAASDLYVLSSEHEGFGIVLQEAMAAGLPIVATSHGGQTDLLEEGRNALLLESNEPRCIARGVSRLLGDDALRAQMSRRNRKKIELYDAASVAQRYVELFREVARPPVRETFAR
jgi:glycosyltransferase involved in cell wall biosynthesis